MENGGAVRLMPLHSDLVGRQLGRYQVLGQIAAGGMAGIYVARAHGVAGFERLVAIKVLHPHLAYEDEFISMFLDEARLAARIRHPNVVATLDVSDSKGGGYFLVMDYIEGANLAMLLRQAIETNDRLPEPVVLRIVIDSLAGLGAAHELTDDKGDRLNLVHRDVSPHNVLVGVDGIARLTDFGIASASKRLTSTRQGTFKGKISYSSPEQALQRPVDGRADLFAMGIVLWESLTSSRLFRAEDESGTLQKLLHDPIASPSSVVPALAPYDAVLGKALERDPDRRFQSALEFADALEALGEPIARLRDVSETVRKRAGDRLADDAVRLQTAMAVLGSAGVGTAAPPQPQAPRIYDPDLPTLTANDDTHIARKGSRAGQHKARGLRGLVRRWPIVIVAVALVLGLVLAAVVVGSDGPRRPTKGRSARRAVPAATPRSADVSAPDRSPVPPPAAVAEPAEPTVPEGPAPAKRGRSAPAKRRDRAAPASSSDPEEDILLNPYRR